MTLTGAPADCGSQPASNARRICAVSHGALAAVLMWLVLLASRPAAADTCEPPREPRASHCTTVVVDGCDATERYSKQHRLAELAAQRQCAGEHVFPEDGITAVPICLESEASAVAPLPILAVEDSRIETPRCKSKRLMDQLMQRLTPDSDDQPSDRQSDNPDPALLPTATSPPAVSTLVKVDGRFGISTGPQGVRHPIFRPPRAS